jgi:hypothetical protein
MRENVFLLRLVTCASMRFQEAGPVYIVYCAKNNPKMEVRHGRLRPPSLPLDVRWLPCPRAYQPRRQNLAGSTESARPRSMGPAARWRGRRRTTRHVALSETGPGVLVRIRMRRRS